MRTSFRTSPASRAARASPSRHPGAGVKESDTGLAPPSLWDLRADKMMMEKEQPLQVARCTKIINPGQDDAKYMIKVAPVRRQGRARQQRARHHARAAGSPRSAPALRWPC